MSDAPDPALEAWRQKWLQDSVHSPTSPTAHSSPALSRGPSASIAAALICPLTKQLLTDPVFTMDGVTYERKAIEAWLAEHDTSPATGKPLPSKMLVDNVRTRGMVRAPAAKRRAPTRTRATPPTGHLMNRR